MVRLANVSRALVAISAAIAQDSITLSAAVALLILGLFSLASTNFDVTARAGMGISGNVMVLIASLVVFRAYGFFLGPVVVGCCGALDLTQLVGLRDECVHDLYL